MAFTTSARSKGSGEAALDEEEPATNMNKTPTINQNE